MLLTASLAFPIVALSDTFAERCISGADLYCHLFSLFGQTAFRNCLPISFCPLALDCRLFLPLFAQPINTVTHGRLFIDADQVILHLASGGIGPLNPAFD